jgi:hypothetical protein
MTPSRSRNRAARPFPAGSVVDSNQIPVGRMRAVSVISWPSVLRSRFPRLLRGTIYGWGVFPRYRSSGETAFHPAVQHTFPPLRPLFDRRDLAAGYLRSPQPRPPLPAHSPALGDPASRATGQRDPGHENIRKSRMRRTAHHLAPLPHRPF